MNIGEKLGSVAGTVLGTIIGGPIGAAAGPAIGSAVGGAIEDAIDDAQVETAAPPPHPPAPDPKPMIRSKTVWFGLIVAVAPAALQWAIGVDWTTYVSPTLAAVIVGVATIGLRLVTSGAIGRD